MRIKILLAMLLFTVKHLVVDLSIDTVHSLM